MLAAAAARTQGSTEMSGGGVDARGMGDALLDRGQRFTLDGISSSLVFNVSDSNRTVFGPSDEVVATVGSTGLPSSFLVWLSDSAATSGVCNNIEIIDTIF